MPAKVHGSQTDIANQDTMFSQSSVFNGHFYCPFFDSVNNKIIRKMRGFQRIFAAQYECILPIFCPNDNFISRFACLVRKEIVEDWIAVDEASRTNKMSLARLFSRPIYEVV
jgi:hypothetical protein